MFLASTIGNNFDRSLVSLRFPGMLKDPPVALWALGAFRVMLHCRGCSRAVRGLAEVNLRGGGGPKVISF